MIRMEFKRRGKIISYCPVKLKSVQVDRYSITSCYERAGTNTQVPVRGVGSFSLSFVVALNDSK